MSQIPAAGTAIRVPTTFLQQQLTLPSGAPGVGQGIAQAGLAIANAIENIRGLQNKRRLAELEVTGITLLSDLHAKAMKASLDQDMEQANNIFRDGAEAHLNELKGLQDRDLRDAAVSQFAVTVALTGASLRSALVQQEGKRLQTAHEAFFNLTLRGVEAGTISVDEATEGMAARLKDGVRVYMAPEQFEVAVGQAREQFEAAARDLTIASISELSSELSSAAAIAPDQESRDFFRAAFVTALDQGVENRTVTHQQRVRHLRAFDRSIQAHVTEEVHSIERRSADFADDEGSLSMLSEEVAELQSRWPDHSRVRDAVVDVTARLQKARGIGNDTEQFLKDLDDPTKIRLQASDAVLDSAIRASGPNTPAALDVILEKVGRVPPEIRRRMKADGNRNTLNLPRFLQHAFVIDSHNRPTAEREAEAVGDIGEVAYYAVRDIDDRVERDLRINLLSRQNIGEAIDRANLLLGLEGTAAEQKEASSDPLRMEKAVKKVAGPRFSPLVPFMRQRTSIGTAERSWMNQLFRFRLAVQMIGLNQPAEKAVANAEAGAVGDFLSANESMIITDGLTVTAHFIPRRLLDLRGGFSAERAKVAIRERLISVMGELSDEAVFVGSKGIVDEPRSQIPVYDKGLVGYVTWDSQSGTSRFTSRTVEPAEFERIGRLYGGTLGPGSFQAHDAARLRPGQELFELDQADMLVDIALTRYANTHDGAMPAARDDPEFISILTEVIREASNP